MQEDLWLQLHYYGCTELLYMTTNTIISNSGYYKVSFLTIHNVKECSISRKVHIKTRKL